ncbi:hypothetical protein chiPu_0028465, partial [Chiloscyllium punctatum]|nr:hypothetical protein [Chiloscyllium punctatum]
MSASALAAVASGQALSQPKPVFEPVEDDFIGQSGIIDMSLHGSGFGTTEQDQAGVAMTVAQLIAEFSQRTWKQPAGFARGDEQRTFDAARDRIGLLEPSGLRIVACLPIEEASFVRVPYSGIANGGGKPGITCCRAGHQGGIARISHDGDPRAVDTGLLRKKV